MFSVSPTASTTYTRVAELSLKHAETILCGFIMESYIVFKLPMPYMMVWDYKQNRLVRWKATGLDRTCRVSPRSFTPKPLSSSFSARLSTQRRRHELLFKEAIHALVRPVNPPACPTRPFSTRQPPNSPAKPHHRIPLA